MKRDMDLIRELLLKLEALPIRQASVVHIMLDENDPEDDLRVDVGFNRRPGKNRWNMPAGSCRLLQCESDHQSEFACHWHQFEH
jgi:hypothetical protein